MNLASWFKQTIYVASVTGKDSNGKLSYESPRAVAARVELRRRMVIKANGDEVQSTHRIYTADAINITDRVWVPGQNPALVEGSNSPLTVDTSSDKSLAKILYRVDV